MTETKRPWLKRVDQITKTIDAFVSQVTGAGTAADKFYSYGFEGRGDLDAARLEELYTEHDIAAAIVDRLVHDALRSGYVVNWQGAKSEDRRALMDWAEQKYAVTRNVRDARVYSRLYGGGGVFLGIEGQLETEAMLGREVRFARAVRSPDCKALTWYAEPADEKYSQVATYRLRSPSFQPSNDNPRQVMGYYHTEIHASRIVPFYGVIISDFQRYADKGWGKSILQRVFDVLLKFDSSFDAILHTLLESSVPVYGVEGLLELLAGEGGDLLAKRFQLINAAKSQYRAVVKDKEETFERVEARLNEAANVVQTAMLRVAAAANMPATLLWQMSPSGLHATGQSDLENWNQQVSSEQKLVLGPGIETVYEWLIASPDCPVSGIEELRVEWPAVETLSPQDKTNLYAQRAAADKIYFDMGAATAAEIAEQRVNEPDSQFPTVDLSHLAELDRVQKDQLLSPPQMVAPDETPTDDPDTP